jgi:hypothetical protein
LYFYQTPKHKKSYVMILQHAHVPASALLAAFILTGCLEKAFLEERDGRLDVVEEDPASDEAEFTPDVSDPDTEDALQEETPPADVTEDFPGDDGCEPGTGFCLDDDTLASCGAEGILEYLECGFGCTEDGGAHCMSLVPSNVGDSSLLCMEGTTDFDPSTEAKYIFISGATGRIQAWDESWSQLPDIRPEGEGIQSGIGFTQVSQGPSAPLLGVYSVQNFTVPAGVYMRSFSSSALVILACGNVTIDGRLSVSATSVTVGPSVEIFPGAGGGGRGEGQGAGGNGGSDAPVDWHSGGGGGGGFGGAGGGGGTSWGGSGGTTYGNDELVPLPGGSGGGPGADNSSADEYGQGGPAGGALQISATGTITVAAGAEVDANGWGGKGGRESGGGGGGGSGGAILLEAQTVTIEGNAVVTANGGGGGGAGDYTHPGTPGQDGQTGQMNTAAAQGGAPAPGTEACWGGDGNSSTVMNGETQDCSRNNGGGGGGGAGRIRFNAMTHDEIDGIISPGLTATDTTTTTGLPNRI